MTTNTGNRSQQPTTWHQTRRTLSQLLQEVGKENPHGAGTLQLTFFQMETGSVTWALEESNRRTLLGLMSWRCVVNHYTLENMTENTWLKFMNRLLTNWNLFLFDGFGSFDPDIIYNRIEYLAAGLDTKVVFLDHLSILLSGLDGDERRMIDTTMTRLRSLVERTGISLFLVSHLRRGHTDQGHEEGARVSLGQLRGSAAIAQLSDTVIALERDQQSGSMNTLIQLLESSRIAILGKLA